MLPPNPEGGAAVRRRSGGEASSTPRGGFPLPFAASKDPQGRGKRTGCGKARPDRGRTRAGKLRRFPLRAGKSGVFSQRRPLAAGAAFARKRGGDERTARKRPVNVVAAEQSRDVQHFAAEVEPRHLFAFEPSREAGELHAARCGFGLFQAFRARGAAAEAMHGVGKALSVLFAELRAFSAGQIFRAERVGTPNSFGSCMAEFLAAEIKSLLPYHITFRLE